MRFEWHKFANLGVHSIRFPESAVCLRCQYPERLFVIPSSKIISSYRALEKGKVLDRWRTNIYVVQLKSARLVSCQVSVEA